MTAMYLVLAAVVTMSAFFVTLTLASAVLGAVTSRLLRAVARQSPRAQSHGLFAALACPSALAVGVASVGVLLPFVFFEPIDTDERAPFSLSVLAVAGTGMLCVFVSRLVRSWRATDLLRRAWMERARPLGAESGLEAFAIDEPFPIVAVVGIRRPVLFVSERVLESCSRNEVAAMMAHERAHVRTRDNFRRLVLNACVDFVPSARRIELSQAWRDATEKAADSAAADRGETSVVDLASALVSIGRLAQSGTPVPSVSSAFYSGSGVESRVRRLLQRGATTEPVTRSLASSIMAASVAAIVAMLAAAPLVYEGTEALIKHLP
jgi:Peptidase family M48